MLKLFSYVNNRHEQADSGTDGPLTPIPAPQVNGVT